VGKTTAGITHHYFLEKHPHMRGVSGNGKDTKYGNGGFCGYLKRDYHSREYWVSKEG
jgi:hypothetical protein